MNLILIPVYNDWKSLNKLLLQINSVTDNKSPKKILIVDDFSTIKMNIIKKKLNKIKSVEVLRLSKNLGSQKAIAFALNYLNTKKNNFKFITIIDGDGEDNPKGIKKMLSYANDNKDRVVVSCRIDRIENFLIKFGYKIHLLLTAFLTGHWISFGNFSCFHINNLKNILADNSVWHAYSAAVIKNSKIKRIYASRAKRYYDKSQVKLSFLVGHSLRIIGVFYKRVVLFSILFFCFIYFLNLVYSWIFYIIILTMNLFLAFMIMKSKIEANVSFKLLKIK
jgi:polyisoprenyl-phosphate glycosyltransferase